MNTRYLKDIAVSEIGMGCMGFSHGYGQIPERDYSIKAIRNAFEYGCTFYDTAEVYGNVLYYEGHNEEIVGEAVKDFRKDIVLATKLHLHDDEVLSGQALYEAVKSHLVRSMKRLGVDMVDLYYLHRVHPNVPVEDVADVMGHLISDGMIRGWGLSQVSGKTLRKADSVTPVSAVQNLYNMLERDCETDIFPYCMEKGIGVVPFSPIASGFLSGKFNSTSQFEKVDDVRTWVPQLSQENMDGNRPIIDILNRYAAEKGATNAQIALAWMLHKYPNVVPIPGSKNQERIVENLKASEVKLSDAEFKALGSALDSCKIYGHRGHIEVQGTVHKNN